MASVTFSGNRARAGLDVIIPWVEYYNTNSTWATTKTWKWAKLSHAMPTTGFISGQVLNWGTISRALSDAVGEHEASRFSWTIFDVDGDVQNQYGQDYGYFINRLAKIQLTTYDEAVLGVNTPLVALRGVVRDLDTSQPLQVTFHAEDYLSMELGMEGLDEYIPKRVISSTTGFTAFPDNFKGFPVPIIYGDMTGTSIGAVPGMYAGTAAFDSNYHVIILAGHACKSVDKVYIGEEDQTPAIGTDVLIPGGLNWPHANKYVDINGNRYTVVYVLGTKAANILNGAVMLTANVKGIETSDGTALPPGGNLADGNGTLLTNIYDQFLHFLVNFFFGNYQTGGWASNPELWSDSTSRINVASFATAKTATNNRIGGGYVGAGAFGLQGDRPSRAQALARWAVSADCRYGFNIDGQFMVAVDDNTTPTDRYTQELDIIKDSFKVTFQASETRNVVPYLHTPDFPGLKWLGYKQVVHQASVTAYDTIRQADPFQFWFIRSATIAENIAKTILWRLKQFPREVTFETGLHGLSTELGEMIYVDHAFGPYPNGYSSRKIWVNRVELDLNRFVVRITGLDWDDYDDTFSHTTEDYYAGQTIGVGSTTGAVAQSGGNTIITTITNTVTTVAPTMRVYLGGSRSEAVTTAVGGWEFLPEYVDVILDSSKCPSTFVVNIHCKTSSAGCTVTPRVVTLQADGVTIDTVVGTGVAKNNTSWTGSGHWQAITCTPQVGVHAYRIQLQASVANTDVFAAGAMLEW